MTSSNGLGWRSTKRLQQRKIVIVGEGYYAPRTLLMEDGTRRRRASAAATVDIAVVSPLQFCSLLFELKNTDAVSLCQPFWTKVTLTHIYNVSIQLLLLDRSVSIYNRPVTRTKRFFNDEHFHKTSTFFWQHSACRVGNALSCGSTLKKVKISERRIPTKFCVREQIDAV